MAKAFSITDIGKNRKVNQDYFYTSEKPLGRLSNLFIVADGMGGHRAGDFASRTAVGTMVDEVERSREEEPVRLFGNAIRKANEKVFYESWANEEFRGMGTTVVASTIFGSILHVANVGDSRLYIINEGKIRQITRDHSLVEELIRNGALERKDARNHPDKNKITRAVGVEENVRPDFFSVELKENDLILMCTDGLTNMLTDEEICGIVLGAGDLAQRARMLIDAANGNGGKDNVTVVLIDPST